MTDHSTPALPSITTVLAATDFSDGAATAVRWAIGIGLRHRARVELVHAIEAAPLESVALEIQQGAEARLAEVAESHQAEGVELDYAIVPGRPWEAVVHRAAEIGADLIVLGTRGRTESRRLHVGSVADRVVRTAGVPVLCVHPEDGVPDRLEHVLVPIDFSEEALLAAKAAKRLLAAATDTGRLTLLYACDLPFDYGIAVSANVIARAREDDVAQALLELEELADQLRTDRLEVDVMARPGYAATIVVEEADRLDIDFVALGTRGRTGLSRLLLGSVAERVLHHATCPVLTVRRPAEDAQVVDAAVTES